MFPNQRLDSRDLSCTKPARVFPSKRIQPELCLFAVAFSMNVWWLVPVARKEEEPIGPGKKDSRSHPEPSCQLLWALASASVCGPPN
jgi:hypothetical protein